MNATTQKSLTVIFNRSQKSFLTTHTSLTLNKDATIIGMKTAIIRTNWSAKVLKKT